MRLALIATVMSLSLFAAACGAATKESAGTSTTGFPMTVNVDGTTLTFDHPPTVLVDQYEATYPVAAAGGNRTSHIVAVTGDANQPLGAVGETLANVPRLATFETVSKEVIIGQKPNLVITHGLNTGLSDQLAPLGIKTMIVNVCWDGYAAAHGGRVGFDAIYDDITTIGKLLGTQDYAARSVASLKHTVATVQQNAQNLPKESVAVTAGLFSGSFFIYGQPSIANTQIETLGLTNAFSDLPKRGVEVSPEELVARNPDFLVLGYDPVTSNPEKTMQQAMSVPGFATMNAVRNHRILVLSDTYLLGRAVDGLVLMDNAIAAAK
ncbi:MAG: ABC transporter substrate-binding protein [Pseudonocardiaceae bacterium]